MFSFHFMVSELLAYINHKHIDNNRNIRECTGHMGSIFQNHAQDLVTEGDLSPSNTTYQIVKLDNVIENKELPKFSHMIKTVYKPFK